MKKWKVITVSGAAGGETRHAIVNLLVKTEADTVEEVRQLIEAAPDLLEACEAAITWAKTPGNHGGNPYQHNFMGLIKHAIRKAKGDN